LTKLNQQKTTELLLVDKVKQLEIKIKQLETNIDKLEDYKNNISHNLSNVYTKKYGIINNDKNTSPYINLDTANNDLDILDMDIYFIHVITESWQVRHNCNSNNTYTRRHIYCITNYGDAICVSMESVGMENYAPNLYYNKQQILSTIKNSMLKKKYLLPNILIDFIKSKTTTKNEVSFTEGFTRKLLQDIDILAENYYKLFTKY
jgi:hypothetical protein